MRIRASACTRVLSAAGGVLGLAVTAGAQCDNWLLGANVGPSPRQNHAMVYDGESAKLVLFGGYRGGTGFNGETWLWDGENWGQVMTPGPSARGNLALAYDSAGRRVVLFGGAVPNPTTVPIGDTWAWDGATGTWAELSPPSSPAARYNHAMAYDAARGRIVLFGGWTGARAGDTWLFDGQTWTEVFPATLPGARSSHAMVYDSVRERVVMFGGFSGSWRNDTWEWDGTNWAQSPAVGPSGRQYLGLAFDEDRGVTILSCGQQSGFVRADDTWEYDGSAWTQLSVGSPGIRDQHVMAYYPDEQQTVLHGGYAGGANVLADTWVLACAEACYADCDTTTGPGMLDIFDFLCFQNRYSIGAPYACDCDTSTGQGVCDIFDFLCFQNAFSMGCP